MIKIKLSTFRSRLDRLIPIILGLPWLEILAETLKLGRKLWQGMADEGMYEVVGYESTLELLDNKGKLARFNKRERVRYQQNNVVAYQDQAWGDGKILVGYRCTPGTAVDRYRIGRTTHTLISLREIRSKGDEDEFYIEWGIRGGFLKSTDQWETTVSHRTQQLLVQIIFPKSRPPLRLSLIESIRRRTQSLDLDARRRMPDGRWLISWEMRKPRLNERYVLQWDW